MSLGDLLENSSRVREDSSAVRGRWLLIAPSKSVRDTLYVPQQMRDIIAISSKMGHLDIFLTVVSGPGRPEILGSLLPSQAPVGRTTVCARVLRVKLRALVSFFI